MQLTELEAYDAMVEFLDDYYRSIGEPAEIGILLGGLSRDTFADGGPADPAMWQDWVNAISAVRTGETRAARAEQAAYPEVVAYLDFPARMLVRLIRRGTRRSFVYHTWPDCPEVIRILRPPEAYELADLPDSGRLCERCTTLTAAAASGPDAG
jgi:hypothetical protein